MGRRESREMGWKSVRETGGGKQGFLISAKDLRVSLAPQGAVPAIYRNLSRRGGNIGGSAKRLFVIKMN